MTDIFFSKVNLVQNLGGSGSRSVVKKTYYNRAIVTGVTVPLRRSLVERISAKMLARNVRVKGGRTFAVMPPVSFTSNSNTFSFIEGYPLRSVPISKWPKLGQFTELGRLIANLETSITRRGLDGGQVTSRRLGNIIRYYKTGSVAKPAGSYFCLGDLTLANILVSKNGIFLIDFEFAHLSSRGFDIGMLVAELDYRRDKGGGQRRARQALLRGYIGGTGKLANVMVWRNRLARHQARSRNNRGALP